MSCEKAARDCPEAALFHMSVLQKRADFLKAARAKRIPCGSFMLQVRKRSAGEAQGIRVGFTCSKKVGNAVARNHAKRRLREIARLELPSLGHEGFDYVLIGRAEQTSGREFEKLRHDLRRGLSKAHGKPA
jgi:ribonuclease P protein component